MSDKPFYAVGGTWPNWRFVLHTPKPWKTSKPQSIATPTQWKLVDWFAEDAGLSRGKARKEIARGHVLVDGLVEMDADRMLLGSAKVEWRSTS